MKIPTILKKLWSDEDAVVAVEYGLMAAILAMLVVAIGTGLSDSLVAKFNEVIDVLNTPYIAPVV